MGDKLLLNQSQRERHMRQEDREYLEAVVATNFIKKKIMDLEEELEEIDREIERRKKVVEWINTSTLENLLERGAL